MADMARIKSLEERLTQISEGQLIAIENIVTQFEKPFDFRRNDKSDLVSDCVLREFGDTLRIHHCFSVEAFTKDKFEYALAKVCQFCGVNATLTSRGNAGHDITINGVAASLKTQADVKIKDEHVHISKFMELGKGKWGDDVGDLLGLRDNFFHHMRNYDRILTLRRLRGEPGSHLYELVEIPKSLLLESTNGEFIMMSGSTQSPKPGYCTVSDIDGKIKFQLYFDGGTERKLQIKKIDKSLCIVHAVWKFDTGAKINEGVVNPG